MSEEQRLRDELEQTKRALDQKKNEGGDGCGCIVFVALIVALSMGWIRCGC